MTWMGNAFEPGVCARGRLKLMFLATSASLVATSAMAQTAPPAATQPVEETQTDPGTPESQPATAATATGDIVVTGSRITANGFQQPTPVTVLGLAEIQRENPTTLANYLNTLPAFGTPTSSANPGVGVSGGGASLLNLRNLGVTRTLVLLDNRRIVSSSPSGGVDINTLPTGLIQRVEVVTGGASAAWGADAVAGVVNFVLNHDYKGFGVELSNGISEQGDNPSYRLSLTFGTSFAGGRGHIIAAGEYSNQPGIVRVRSRDWWKNWAVVPNPAYAAGNGQPARITVAGAGPTELAEGGVITSTALRGTQFVGPNGTPAPYNFGVNAGVIQWGGDQALGTSGNRNLTNALNYKTLYSQVRFDLSDRVTIYAEGSYGKSIVYADSLYYNRGGNLPIQVDNPYLDPGVAARAGALGITSFNIGKMETDLAPPGSRNERRLWRAVAGIDGKFGGDWKWGAYYQHGDFQTYTRTYNNPVVSRFNLAVDAVRDSSGNIVCRSTLTAPTNGCAPLNVLGTNVASPAALAYVFGTVPFQLTTLRQDVASASVSGSLFKLPAGPVSIALGGEYTHEQATGTQDPLSQARAYFTGNFQPFLGKRSVKEAFAETVIPLIHNTPLIKMLELNAAARVTDYSTSGSGVTWKLGAS